MSLTREGKNVAILGLGNAALEVSDAASPYANYVHIFTHSGPPPKKKTRTSAFSRKCFA